LSFASVPSIMLISKNDTSAAVLQFTCSQPSFADAGIDHRMNLEVHVWTGSVELITFID